MRHFLVMTIKQTTYAKIAPWQKQANHNCFTGHDNSMQTILSWQANYIILRGHTTFHHHDHKTDNLLKESRHDKSRQIIIVSLAITILSKQSGHDNNKKITFFYGHTTFHSHANDCHTTPRHATLHCTALWASVRRWCSMCPANKSRVVPVLREGKPAKLQIQTIKLTVCPKRGLERPRGQGGEVETITNRHGWDKRDLRSKSCNR